MTIAETNRPRSARFPVLDAIDSFENSDGENPRAVQTVLISGAASGIGRALVVEFLRRGYRTAGIDLNVAALKGLQLEFGRERFAWRAAEVTDEGSLATAVAELTDELRHVDLLVAAAGIAPYTSGESFDAAAVARVINVNLIGTANLIANVLPGMLDRRRGHIVAVSSLASYRGLPKNMAYCASKAGLNVLMDGLRLDVRRRGVAVTTVCPGHTRTAATAQRFVESSLAPMDETVREIMYAIDRRKPFHAFPRRTVWELNLMRLLPAAWQDWLVERRLRRVTKPTAPLAG